MYNKRLFSIIGGIALIVFNVVFFLLKPEEIHSSGWISLAFMEVALIVLTGIPWIENSYSVPNLNVTTNTIALIYACVAVIAGVVITAWIMINVSSNRKTATDAEKDLEDQLFIKSLTKKVSVLIAECKSDDVKKELEKLYTEVHASPIVSTRSNKCLEHEIENRIDRLLLQIYSLDTNTLILEIRRTIEEIQKRNYK